MQRVELLQCTYEFNDGNLTNPIAIPSGYAYVGRDDLDQGIGEKLDTRAIYLFPASGRPVYLGKSVAAFSAMVGVVSVFDFSSGDRGAFEERIKNIDPLALADPNGLWAYIIESHFEEA